jgi:hypothetical protein
MVVCAAAGVIQPFDGKEILIEAGSVIAPTSMPLSCVGLPLS